MKFTPENLLQIYLNGAFTDEAQAEFDALMRKDPAFVEKVTQALAERLGPVPEDVVNGVSSRLDGKVGDLWKRNKPSPTARVLKFGLGTAVVLAASGGLFLGGRLPVAKIHVPAISETSHSDNSPVSDTKTPNKTKKAQVGNGSAKSTASSPDSGNTSSSAGQKFRPANTKNSASILPPASAANQNSLGSIPNSALSTSPSGNPALSAKPPARGVTAEGNSLRVAIDTDKTENVEVTVYDANGLLIRHLYDGVLPAGEHTVDWDGKDELGNTVLPGDYTVILGRGGKKMSGILKVLPNR